MGRSFHIVNTNKVIWIFIGLWVVVFAIFYFRGRHYCERLQHLQPADVRTITFIRSRYSNNERKFDLTAPERQRFLELLSRSEIFTASKVKGGDVWEVTISAPGDDFELLLYLGTSAGCFVSKRGGGSFENMRNPDFQAFEAQLLSAHATPTPSPAGSPTPAF